MDSVILLIIHNYLLLINMFLKLNKLYLPFVRSLKINNKLYFSKEAPAKKEGGKKDDKSAPAAPVVV